VPSAPKPPSSSRGARRGPLPLPQAGEGFRSLEEARALLAGGAARLQSFAGAGASAGPGWFQAIVEALEAELPTRPFEAVLDCGDEPGAALAALRRGVRHVRLAGKPETLRRVSDIAAQLGAVLETNETGG
jgi:hypothetical protein